MEIQNYLEKKIRKYLAKFLFIFLIAFSIIYNVECQESEASGSIIKGGSYEQTFSTVRIGLAQSVMIVPKGEFHLIVQHRFTKITGSIDEFFGLDFALTRLGFDYGIFNWLSAGIGRSMTVQTYDLALKALLLKQNEDNTPFSLSLYSSFLENTSQGPSWIGHNSFGSRLTYVNQLNIARNQGIFSLQVAPLWLHSNYETRTDGSINIFGLDVSTRIRLSEMLGIIVEYIPVLTKTDITGTNPFTIGLDINTGGHQFQVFFSNGQGTNEMTALTNTVGSWSKGNVFFGFNLTRVFNPKID